jgi:hypothetical protein
VETPREQTEQTLSTPQELDAEFLAVARDHLLNGMSVKDTRTNVLAAAGVMNYYLAREIGQLISIMHQPYPYGVNSYPTSEALRGEMNESLRRDEG